MCMCGAACMCMCMCNAACMCMCGAACMCMCMLCAWSYNREYGSYNMACMVWSCMACAVLSACACVRCVHVLWHAWQLTC